MQLGKHAKRMLEIGKCMDALESLGFQMNISSNNLQCFQFTYIYNHEIIWFLHLYVYLDKIHLFGGNIGLLDFDYLYSSPDWQQELLTKIKGLIDVK